MIAANAMAAKEDDMNVCKSRSGDGMCTHEMRYARRAQGNTFAGKHIAEIKQKRAQGGCLGTKSRRKT